MKALILYLNRPVKKSIRINSPRQNKKEIVNMSLYTIARKPGTGAIIWSEDQKQYIKHKYVDEDKTLAEIAKEFQV